MTFQDLQGFCTEGECLALQEAARGLNVLEIGCWKARTTVALAATAAHVTAVDTFLGDRYTGAAFTLPEAFRNIHATGLLPRITLVAGDYFTVARHLNFAAFDFVFYDADHDYEPTRRALETFHALPTHAIIALHDYEPAYPQVIRAVGEFAGEAWEVRAVEKLAFLKRKT